MATQSFKTGRAITKHDGYQAVGRQMFCAFCKRNGESVQRFMDHNLKDSSGKVCCPRLRAHVCERKYCLMFCWFLLIDYTLVCGATGDEAHTRSYCPMAAMARTDPFFKEMFDPIGGNPAFSFHNMVALKKTRVNSAGKVRRRY